MAEEPERPQPKWEIVSVAFKPTKQADEHEAMVTFRLSDGRLFKDGAEATTFTEVVPSTGNEVTAAKEELTKRVNGWRGADLRSVLVRFPDAAKEQWTVLFAMGDTGYGILSMGLPHDWFEKNLQTGGIDYTLTNVVKSASEACKTQLNDLSDALRRISFGAVNRRA